MSGNELLTEIAGVPVLWKSDCGYELEKLSKLFKHHVCDSCGNTSPHVIEFKPTFTKVAVPSDAKVKWDGYYVGCFHQKNHVTWFHSAATGLDYLVLSGEMWVVHDRQAATTTCYMYCRRTNGRYVERPEFADPIILLLHTVPAMYHRYTIHAAAVEIGGQAHVLVGESGHGKSTLCVDLVAQGANYMGDDIVYLYRDGSRGTVMVGSLLFEAKLFPPGTKRRKDFFDIVDLYGQRGVKSSPLKGIYYVCRSKERHSRLERLPAIDAIVRLLRASNNARMQYDVDEWQQVCQSAATDVPYYIFRFGDRELLELSMFENA